MKMHYTGRSFIVSWEELNGAIKAWTKTFFGNHVKAEIYDEQDHDKVDNNIMIHFTGFTGADRENFEKMFSQFDMAGWWNSHDEFEEEVKGNPHGNYILPASVAAGILYYLVSEETTTCLMSDEQERLPHAEKVSINEYCTCSAGVVFLERVVPEL